MRMKTRIIFLLLLFVVLAARMSYADSGILLLAHGGSPEWNSRVTELVAQVDRTKPTEVAFGMATRANIQAAVDRLVERGVTEIVAVPLFVSSWSSVITSTEYLLGLRAEAPAALAMYEKMRHPQPAANSPSHATPAGHEGHATVGATSPVKSPVPIRMTRALNDHPIVADILTSRAESISRDPAEESLVIVAHGPNAEDDNRRWLADMASLAERIARTETFASIDYLTLRDDAPKPVRDAATAELRQIVAKGTQEGRRVLVVPLLVSFGGIERGLRQRLEGLPYVLPDAGLMPDARLATWVLAMAQRPETFGAGVSLTETTPLVGLLERPGDFEGKTVRVEGIVTAVCMHMGCWMALASDAGSDARTVLVKVDDGVIVFPVSAKGRRAVAQGVVERIGVNNAEGQKAAAEHADAAQAKGNVQMSWQLKATGALVY
jgi:sirohydrochlorin ferrochelatase